MKYVVFKKIQVKNLLSIGDEWVEIDYRTGINFVTGINYDKDSQNGLGKTSLLVDSLFFALFGTLARTIKKEFIVNRFTNKGTKVVLSFDITTDGIKDEYILQRSINPTKLQLTKNSTEDITKSSMQKTTEYICGLVGASPDVFANTVVMTLNGTVPFMAQNKVDKRNFIEGILKLEVFSNMLLQARQEYNDHQKEYTNESTRLEELKNSLGVYISQKETFETKKQEKIAELTRRKEGNKKEIEIERTKIVTSENNLAEIKSNIVLLQEKESQCNTQINNLYQLIGINETELKGVERDIAKLLERGDICIKCKREFTETDRNSANQKIVTLKSQKFTTIKTLNDKNGKLSQIEELKHKCEAVIKKLQDKINAINLINKENEYLVTQINKLVTWNDQLDKDIETIKTEEDHFTNLIAETQEREKTLVTKCAELKNKLKIIDTVKFIVSEEGVKSFIVKKILKVLNSKLAYYLKQFDSNCTLVFNEYFEERLVDNRGIETTYNNFSAGERKRIDLACLFTFKDIRRLQGDVSTNISIYDELFDSSLEEKGVFMALDILKEHVEKYNEAIYIITHKKDVQKYLAGEGEIVFLEKRNGITTRSTDYSSE